MAQAAEGAGEGEVPSSNPSSSSLLPSWRPPLFEMHFEMNPRDPEYDAKIYLAVDQVNQGSTAVFRRNEEGGRWLRITGKESS